jgi:hypothetical protein
MAFGHVAALRRRGRPPSLCRQVIALSRETAHRERFGVPEGRSGR